MTEPRHEGMSNERLKHLWAAAAVEFRITNPGSCDKQREAACDAVRELIMGYRSQTEQLREAEQDRDTYKKWREEGLIEIEKLTAQLAAAERNEHAAMLKIEQLEADNAVLREAATKALDCIEIQNMHSWDEQPTVEAAIANGFWCKMAINARALLLKALGREA